MVRGGRKIGSEFRNLPSRARHYAISISTPLSLNQLEVVGLSRFELLTPRLSSVCSNQLSYRPASWTCLGCQRTRSCWPVLSKLDRAHFTKTVVEVVTRSIF